MAKLKYFILTLLVIGVAGVGGYFAAIQYDQTRAIVQAEQDFKDLGYKPIRAEIPAGSIRQINFILDGITGYIKMTTDRDAAVSVEDADRMIRYLSGKEITTFEYIDVRVEEKGYWK